MGRKNLWRSKDPVAVAKHLLSLAVPQGSCLVLKPRTQGYATLQFMGVQYRAHRFIFCHLVEDPGEDDVHHCCETRNCVRLDHLERKTKPEHRKTHGAPWMAVKTHCPQGHPYSGANLRVYKNKRFCRQCAKLAVQKHRQGGQEHGT